MKQVLIAIPKRDHTWNEGFVISLLGTFLFEQEYKDYHFALATVTGKPVVEAREELVNTALEGGFDYIWFLDDDMVFPVNSFRRLISQDKDFISGIAFMKKPPFAPTCLKCKTYRKGKKIHEKYSPIIDYPDDTFEVDGIGLFCAVIKVDAIKKLRTPRFHDPLLDTLSKIGEDVGFCRRMWEAGYKLYCDPNVKTGHLDGKGHLITELDFRHFVPYKTKGKKIYQRMEVINDGRI